MDYAYYNDIDGFCCKVLKKNIALGNLPGGKVDERDIRDVDATDFVGYQHVHLFAGIGAFSLGMSWAGYPSSIRTLTGGFPCQDVSNAGKRAGIEGERSGLWKEMYRLIQEAIDLCMGPDIVLLENVSALVNRGLSTVLGDLAEVGMDARWCVLQTSYFEAPHQRERIFIVAYPNSQQFKRRRDIGELVGTTRTSESSEEKREWIWNTTGNSHQALAYTNSQRLQVGNGGQSQTGTRTTVDGYCEGQPQRRLGGMFTGLPEGLDRPQQWPAGPGEPQHSWEPPRTVIGKQQDRAKRLKALGNAIVPQCVQYVAEQVLINLEVAS